MMNTTFFYYAAVGIGRITGIARPFLSYFLTYFCRLFFTAVSEVL